MKKLSAIIILLIFGGCYSYAIEEVNNNKVYWLHDCIKTAIENSPEIKKAKYNYEISKSDYLVAKAVYFPTLGAGVAFNQFVNSNKDYDDGYTKRTLPDLKVYLRQLIFDFGKTGAKINLHNFYKIAAEYEYTDSICETVNNVKNAYFTALEAKSAVEIQKSNLLLNEKINEHIKKLYESGQKSEADYINSKVYLISAKMMLEDAENAYTTAMANLSNAMYAEDLTDIQIKNINEFNYVDAYFTPAFSMNLWSRPDPATGEKHRNKEYEADILKIPFTIDEAYQSAYERNPELKVLESTLDAMKQLALTVKREYYPTLNAQVGYGNNGKYISQKDPIKNNQLNVAVTLDSSVNILAKKHEIDRVNFQIKSAENDIELFKKNIYYEIKKAYADVLTAEKQIVNSKEKVDAATDNLTITINAYNNPDSKTGYLELQDARKNYNAAKLDYISKLRLYNISLARLEKATHIHTHDNHDYHKTNPLNTDNNKTGKT